MPPIKQPTKPIAKEESWSNRYLTFALYDSERASQELQDSILNMADQICSLVTTIENLTSIMKELKDTIEQRLPKED